MQVLPPRKHFLRSPLHFALCRSLPSCQCHLSKKSMLRSSAKLEKKFPHVKWTAPFFIQETTPQPSEARIQKHFKDEIIWAHCYSVVAFKCQVQTQGIKETQGLTGVRITWLKFSSSLKQRNLFGTIWQLCQSGMRLQNEQENLFSIEG